MSYLFPVENWSIVSKARPPSQYDHRSWKRRKSPSNRNWRERKIGERRSGGRNIGEKYIENWILRAFVQNFIFRKFSLCSKIDLCWPPLARNMHINNPRNFCDTTSIVGFSNIPVPLYPVGPLKIPVPLYPVGPLKMVPNKNKGRPKLRWTESWGGFKNNGEKRRR